jgi:hypothetical protein
MHVNTAALLLFVSLAIPEVFHFPEKSEHSVTDKNPKSKTVNITCSATII